MADSNLKTGHSPPPPWQGISPSQGPRRAGVHRKSRNQGITSAISYKGYRAGMTFDVQDKIIVGRVQDIDGIITFHGESIAKFESRFHTPV